MGKLSLNLNDVMGKLEDQRNINEAATNHTAESDSTPKTPPKSRPSVPPAPRPPRPSPAGEVPQEGATHLFGDATTAPMPTPSPTPDAAVPAPSQAPSWDSWKPPAPEPQQDEDEAVQPDQSAHQQPTWDDPGTASVANQQPTWDDPGTASAANQPSWDNEGTQGQTWDDPGQGQAYDQQTTWDDSAGGQDHTQTQAGWGDPGQEQLEAAAASGTSGAESESNAVTNGASESGEFPPGVVYKVKALHDYAATDGDELEMKSGDVVLVLAFDSPDEQDEGWLMGVKESHWLANQNLSVRGVFPENFTQRC
ncbi:myc box-dependent-interacting protein 1-like isoform X1 [Clupea harengus]|uniref:Myc box-dependent-interacting protein 1-like isoform X1 n=1 Tax=Clupea harengus TaxID=7950 RepID=A0A6P8EF95_CLUHA|nr:myc box-dependent-interacting protein 1-like isoform X1 [Clupea harengus]